MWVAYDLRYHGKYQFGHTDLSRITIKETLLRQCFAAEGVRLEPQTGNRDRSC